MAAVNKAWDLIIRVPEPRVDYEKSALVVIDLQYNFASRDHGLFKRVADAGLMDEAMYAINRFEEFAIPNTRRLADTMRAAGRPIVWCRCASIRGDGSDQTRRHRAQGLICPVWERGADIIDELGVQQGDIVLTKSGSGCFTSTNLDHILRNMDVTGVVLTGCWTNSCVETTARHAGDLDYDVVIVEDAVVAMTERIHDHALEYMDNNWGRVQSTDEVINAFSTLPTTRS